MELFQDGSKRQESRNFASEESDPYILQKYKKSCGLETVPAAAGARRDITHPSCLSHPFTSLPFPLFHPHCSTFSTTLYLIQFCTMSRKKLKNNPTINKTKSKHLSREGRMGRQVIKQYVNTIHCLIQMYLLPPTVPPSSN